ncbi:GNAT family N-acetyltransferase [Microbacterium thalassium]|uniref:Putative acetyltransferase n=1 Tax=Microbacterium thalassium TaxID=362649 RepID=A0A7X0KVQ9_9MICO|nr:GNAT family N-acetyltransferase [Microbacterium thalassium]MBB6392448.1 putative acetyltransferase [Microbacterium thalassium]GLK23320.1 UPF0256 protein [Microbacterium thalassium]
MTTTAAGDPLARAWLDAPVDDAASAALSAGGLEVRRVGQDDRAAYAAWLQATARGFLDSERTDAQIDASWERAGHRRPTGVYDATGAMPEIPVGTIGSWIAQLTVPGERAVPTCAISAVTVAPTHRRRGIARAMLEGELREAAALGVPVASLTVSESTIYGRFGFAPAAAAASWRLNTKRATWTGPVPDGRVDFVSRTTARALAAAVHERVRLRTPGEVGVPAALWDSLAGTRPDAKDPGTVRAVRYADAAGEVQGVALYTVRENPDDYPASSATVTHLVAATDDAYAALWRCIVELDLIGEVRASELAVDEPLLWMISDQRAATITVSDHHYVRVLDVRGALEGRTFGAAGVVALTVEDRLGIAGGDFVLEADAEGRGIVRPGAAPEGAVTMSLGVAELSAMLLGGASVAMLAAAGRIRCSDVRAASRVFGWHRQPRLSFWY